MLAQSSAMKRSSASFCLQSLLLLCSSCESFEEVDSARHDEAGLEVAGNAQRSSLRSVPLAAQALATLLVSQTPAALFQPCGQGGCRGLTKSVTITSHPLTLHRRGLHRHRSPAMADEDKQKVMLVAEHGMVPPSKASAKVQLVSNVYAGKERKVELTTHEGQMKMLEKKEGYELPTGILSPRAIAKDFKEGEGVEVLDKGFPWQKHEFLDGAEENERILSGFESIFSKMTGAEVPDWIGLEVALDEPENLRAGMDLSVAYIKNHQLDRCEMLLGRYVLPACAARGLPWVVKAIQDYATLKMKQNRNAESMLLLEKLESMLPPHPIMLHNMGLAYNSVRHHDKAMEKFKQAVSINKGKMAFDDHWNIGITLMHEKHFDQAFPELKQALDMALPDPKVDEITLAKIYSTCCNCLMKEYESIPKDEVMRRMTKAEQAEPYIRQAVTLYNQSVGVTNLYGGATYDLAKNLAAQSRHDEAEPRLHEAMLVEAHKDGIHPTMCHYMLETLMDLHNNGALTKETYSKYHDLLRVMLMNLHIRGFTKDGNGGVVMKEIAEFFMLSGSELVLPAQALLTKALHLVENHADDEADTSVIEWMIKMDLDKTKALRVSNGKEDAAAPAVAMKDESWLLEGPWGVPEGADKLLAIAETTQDVGVR